MAPPKMCFHMDFETIYSSLFYGARSSSLSLGGSVASDSAARVSMMRLTHSICTAVSGLCLIVTAPTIAALQATTFTVS